MIIMVSILAFALTSGQLIRIPIGTQGITFLDITVFLFCALGLLKSRFRLKKPPIQITAALGFLTIATISLAFTPLHLKLPEYLVSFSYTGRLFLYVLFAWIIFSTSLKITKAFLISGIAFAALGLLQFIFFPNLDFMASAGWDPHYFRTVSTFLDPNFAGAFLVLTLLLLVHLGSGPDRTPRVFYLFFAIIYLALLTTFSRSSYLMFLVSGLTFSFFKKSKKFILITLILFAFLLYGFQTYTRLISKPRNIDRTQSASFRLNTWQQGINLFQKAPILGIGFNAYRYGIKEFKLGDEGFLQSHGSSGNDSSLLFVLSTTGILGLIAFIYFLWTLIKTSNILLIAGVAGLLIHSVFANSLFYPPIIAWVLIKSISSQASLISITPRK